jgi:branched-chain amino acid transport system permease protein
MKNRLILYVLVLVILFSLGFTLPTDMRSLSIDIFIFAIYAMAYDILYGYTGQFSYGQAVFFGVAAYGLLLPVLHTNTNLWVSLTIALVITVVFGIVLGFLAVRLGGAYFVIITIIFNLTFYLIALDWIWLTGGDDGLTFRAPKIEFGVFSLSLYDPVVTYYFMLSFLLASYLILKRLISSPIGKVLIAIRENEERAQLIGYNVFRYKLLAYVVSALFTGLSGALYSLRTRYASADYFNIALSVQPIIWTLVGGAGTLTGPIVGVILINPLIYYIGVWWKHYLSIIGALMIFVVIYSPKGIVGNLINKIEKS